MDSPEIDARLSELGVALDGRGVALGEVGVFGVSAAPISPLRTPYELNDELERTIAGGFAAVRAGLACARKERGDRRHDHEGAHTPCTSRRRFAVRSAADAPRRSTCAAPSSPTTGGTCSFETFLDRYELEDPALHDIARIVHEADLSTTTGTTRRKRPASTSSCAGWR
ncbi:MAG TPA: chromate resistance protein ChrB domain-containing protein [Gaiellaceae bacterium]|jgi:hypothetical protein